jgi:hypothetical protein
MISEKAFASTFSSFWQNLAPMGDDFVRTMNLAVRHFDRPMHSASSPSRRALVNEIGFLLYKKSQASGTSVEAILGSDEKSAQISREAMVLVQRYQGDSGVQLAEPESREWTEGLELSRRLKSSILGFANGMHILLSPRFAGCGFIDGCEGDVLAGNTLYEVKAGSRPFRLVDVRQVVIYLALNYAKSRFRIDNVGFLNPRLGTYYQCGVQQFTVGLSGKGAVELLSELVDFVSSGGISR